jgi:hypothetical protein
MKKTILILFFITFQVNSQEFAKYSGSGQAIPTSTYATIDIGSEDLDADNIVSEASGIFTPSVSGYYLILATGRFDTTHNNRANFVWNILQNGSNIAGTGGSGYARNSSNPYLYIRAGAILYFNGTTDTFSVQHKQDTGTGIPAGSYGWTRLKFIRLGSRLPYARYGTPTSGAYSGTTPTAIPGWDVISETDTNIIELQAGGTDIQLKEANRPYLIVYALQNSDNGGARTTRVSDVTLNGTRIGHSAGYAYQRDSANEHAIPFGMALAYPKTSNQNINVRCWGYDDDAAILWGTFDSGAWTLSSNAGDAGVMVIALPSTTDVAIYRDATGGDTISGSATVSLTEIDVAVKTGSNFTKDNDTSITVGTATDVLAWGTIMVERTASSGIRNTSATRWNLEGIAQSDSAYGNYLRGDQGSQDTKNMVLSSNYTDSVNANDTFILEKFDPGTDDGEFDETSWAGAFFIDLNSLSVSTTQRRIFIIN